MRMTNDVPSRRQGVSERAARTVGARRCFAGLGGMACAASLLLACTGSDHTAAGGDSSTAQAGSALRAAHGSTDAAARGGRTTVRGRITAVSDTALTISTSSGDVHVALVAPATIYARVPATLADVQPNTFVGVTSVPDPDGSQHATEIHIFPEALRGTGEGSYPLPQPQGGSASRSTMTNGSIAAGAGGSSRMTNGAARVHHGGTITVRYNGGAQTITVPAGVAITRLTPVNEKLTAGANVVVVATKQPTGALESSTIFLVPGSTPRH